MQINHQNFTIMNFLGALQQLAPPQPFVVDEILRPANEHPEWRAVMHTPKLLKEQMQGIQELIDQLPQLQEEVRDPAASCHCLCGQDRQIFKLVVMPCKF